MDFSALSKKYIVVEAVKDEINDAWTILLDTLQIGYLSSITNHLVDLNYHTLDKYTELPGLGKIQSIWVRDKNKYIIVKEFTHNKLLL